MKNKKKKQGIRIKMLVDRGNEPTHLTPGDLASARLKLPDDLAESKDSGLDTSGSVNGSCYSTKLEERYEKLKEELAFKEMMISALQESNYNLRLRAVAAENKVFDLRVICERHCSCCAQTLPSNDKAGQLEESSEVSEFITDSSTVGNVWGEYAPSHHERMNENPQQTLKSVGWTPKVVSNKTKERRAAFSSNGKRKVLVEEDKTKESPNLNFKTSHDGWFRVPTGKEEEMGRISWGRSSSHFSLIGDQGVSVSPSSSGSRHSRGRNSLDRFPETPSPLGFSPWYQMDGRKSVLENSGEEKEQECGRSQGWRRIYKCLDEADSYAQTLAQGLSRLPHRNDL